MKRNACRKTRQRMNVALWRHQQMIKQRPGLVRTPAGDKTSKVKRAKNAALSTNYSDSLTAR